MLTSPDLKQTLTYDHRTELVAMPPLTLQWRGVHEESLEISRIFEW